MKTYISYYFLIVFLSCKNTDENPTKDRYSTNNTHTTNNTENEYLTLIKHYDLNPEDKIENKQFIDYMNNIHGGKIPFYDEKIYFLPRKGGFKDFKETIIKEFKILNQKELKTFEDLYKILNSIHSLHKKKDSYLDLENIKPKSQDYLFSNKILEFLKGVEKNKLKQELIVLDPDQENLSTSNDFYKIIEKAPMYRIYKRENKDEIILRFFIRLDDKSEKEYNNTKLETKLKKLKLINIRNSSIRLQSKEIQLNEYSKNSSEKLVNMYDEFSKKIEKNYPFLEYILKKIKEKDKNFEIIKDLLKEYYAMTSGFNLSSFPKYFGYSLILKEKGKKCIIRIFYYPLSLNDGNACYFTDAENISLKTDNDKLRLIKLAESEEKKYIEFELN